MTSTPPDISQLSQSQQTALETYTSITDQGPVEAIPILHRAEWNVQIAITRFFEGEPSIDHVAEAQAALPAASHRQSSNIQLDDLTATTYSTSVTGRRSDPNSVGQISTEPSLRSSQDIPLILAILLSPFSIIYRVFATLLSPLGSIFPSLPRFFNRLFQVQGPRSNRRALPPVDNARRFIREFSDQYGTHELPFVESGYNLAFDNAKRDLKLLLVILLSPDHDETNSWVRETVLSPHFVSFVRSHADDIILWGGNVQDAEAYQVAKTVRCNKFPFVGLICPTSDAGSTAMSSVMRAIGPLPASELVAKLGTAMISQQDQLRAARAERQQRQASQNLRQEQDSAYERSLAQDRERARLRQAEAEAQATKEKEFIDRIEARRRYKEALRRWRRRRAQCLASEPDKNAPDSVRISIRLASGERVVRGFSIDAQLEEVYAFVECYDELRNNETASFSEKPESALASEDSDFQHSYTFRLVSAMPRTVYAVKDSGSVGHHLGKGANLIVEPIEEGDEEDEADHNKE